MTSKIRRALRWLLVLLMLALFVMTIVLPFAFAVYATRPAHHTVGAAPDGFETVALETDDGVTLAAWYLPPQNGAAIVLVHGSGDSRDDVRAHAEMLAAHGYGVLALDLRGHGESGGEINRLGWYGTPDAGAALRFLQAREEVEVIGGLGLSVGGEILLGAAADYPALRAIVSEGATYRSLEEFHALPEHRSVINSLQVRLLGIMVELLSGAQPPTPMLDSIEAARDTRLLLIAAEKDAHEAPYNQVFAAAAGSRAEVWVVPDAGHIQGLERAGAEYAQRVIGFFDAALLGGPQGAGAQ